ncbi:diaminopropionate ammonia-lyase [compost metagenome]
MPVQVGESGAAGLAALQVLAADPELARAAGLDASSRVLLFSTEGATAPGVYRALTGHTGEEVVAAQTQWLQREGIAEAALMARIDAHAADHRSGPRPGCRPGR